jgi:MFS family permease
MFHKKRILFLGMLLQAAALLGLFWSDLYAEFVIYSIILGAGTALVYPNFMAAIADFTHPTDRPKSIGVFRLWRDMGYAIGAILTGFIADYLGSEYAILIIGGLTLISALIIQFRMAGK